VEQPPAPTRDALVPRDPDATGELSALSAMARRIAANPFYLLELDPRAGRATIEDAVERILRALAAAMPGADRYRSPFGAQPRDTDATLQAAAKLRDRERRVLCEVWARLPVQSEAVTPPVEPRPWRGGWRALGWRRR
jgi:hypothetical protein